VERSLPPSWEVLDKYTPPFLDSDHPAWVAPYDFAHSALSETDFPREKTDENDRQLIQALVEAAKRCVSEQVVSGLTSVGPGSVIWSAFPHYHLILPKIKRSLDPNNVANPTRLIDVTKVGGAES
jgi:hypothetical protein